MTFYKCFYYLISFILIIVSYVRCVKNPDLRINATVDTVSICGVGIRINADVDNLSFDEDFEVDFSPEQCCIDGENGRQCDIFHIHGGVIENIPRGKKKRMTLVIPTVEPLRKKGFCCFNLDSKSLMGQGNVVRDNVQVFFDTENKENISELPELVKCNHVDEDPFNDCRPVDCETFYNDKKPVYDKRTKRCVEAPACLSSESDLDLPDNMYDPNSNRCIKGDPIQKKDTDYVKTIRHKRNRKAKDILIIKEMKNKTVPTNQKPMSVNLYQSSKESKFSLGNIITNSLPSNKLMLYSLIIIFSTQCFLIVIMIHCLVNKKKCCDRKKVISKYFNYRQDMSDTTPLICSSNVDTETTDDQYVNDSSNYIDEKIKCYKAIHKEQGDQVKTSMSDDVLSKCLNRRDWQRKPVKFDIISKASSVSIHNNNLSHSNTSKSGSQSVFRQEECKLDVLSKDQIEAKVEFENEIEKKSSKDSKSFCSANRSKDLDIVENVSFHSDNFDFKKEENVQYSEKEIKCHDYHPRNVETSGCWQVTREPKIVDSKSFDNFKCNAQVFVGSEKGAQACFSNDTVDNFLSERGTLYLPSDNASKYSSSSNSSNVKKSLSNSEGLNKTSKSNVIKSLQSLLKKKSKQGLSSDTAIDKKMQVLHISTMSLVSSSNNESEYLKTMKTRDSRSTM